jgi:hypothetical protein
MRNKLSRVCVVVLGASVCAWGTPAVAKPKASPAAKASFCAQWRDTCVSSGGGDNCPGRYAGCMSSGCFQTGSKFGFKKMCATEG